MIYVRTCAYNAEKTIRRAMDSVLNQTYRDITYYVLDNGSTDRTGEIVKEYALNDSRVVPFYNKVNRDLTENPQFWLVSHELKEEDYFCILDADDEYDTGNSYGLGPGMINILEPGEDIRMADPSHPNSNFDAFTTAYAKYIGAALEIPSELLLKQFGASYSASKAALEEAWKAFKMRRAWLVDDFCRPVYEIWLTEAIAKGRISAPGFYLDASIREAWCKCAWNGPAQGMLDPLKEIKAANGRVALGVSTREIETMEMSGGNFDDNAAQLKHEAVHMGEINSLLGNTSDSQQTEDGNGES